MPRTSVAQKQNLFTYSQQANNDAMKATIGQTNTPVTQFVNVK